MDAGFLTPAWSQLLSWVAATFAAIAAGFGAYSHFTTPAEKRSAESGPIFLTAAALAVFLVVESDRSLDVAQRLLEESSVPPATETEPASEG